MNRFKVNMVLATENVLNTARDQGVKKTGKKDTVFVLLGNFT